jgi:hypothetical protein
MVLSFISSARVILRPLGGTRGYGPHWKFGKAGAVLQGKPGAEVRKIKAAIKFTQLLQLSIPLLQKGYLELSTNFPPP